MKVHLIPETNNNEILSSIRPNKKEYLFYLEQLNPKSGNKPEVITFINIQKQYALYNKDIKTMEENLPNFLVDSALDQYNQKLKEWEEGSTDMKSILIEMNESDNIKLNKIESKPKFQQWVQKDRVENIKNFINNIRTI
jgi:hypothetical protein